MLRSNRVPHVLLLLAVLIYIGARLWRLDSSCLWFDEMFSIHAAEHDWSGLLSFVALDLVHPPLFYTLLKVWIAIGGESVFWVRSLPVLFACVAIIPVLLLVREIQGETPMGAPLAVFLLAVNGPLIRYSQEVRMYSLFLCLSLFSFWLFIRTVRGNGRMWVLFLINILLVYTHYFGWFVIMAEVVALIYVARARWREFALGVAVTMAAFIPWAVVVARAAQLSDGLPQNIGWTPKPGLLDLARFGLSVLEPFYYPPTTVSAASNYFITAPIFLLVIFLLACLLYEARTWRPSADRMLLLIFIFVPILSTFVASWLLPHSIWGTRHLSMVFAPIAILIGHLIARAPRAIAILSVTLILVFSGYAFVGYADRPTTPYIWCCWGQLASEQRSKLENSGAQIYAFEDLVAYHLWFALRSSGTRVSVIHIAEMPEDPGFFLPRGFDEVHRVELGEIHDKEIWVAFRSATASDGALYAAEPLGSLAKLGYRPTEIHDIQTLAEKAYLVKLER